MSKINTKIVTVKPKDLKLLRLNARYMRHETFQQLVENIKADGKLTQLPFCILEDDGKYKVLSGNHRVKAAIEAGLSEIEIIATDDKLSEDRQTAIQLSHNAISGEDDPAILKAIYEDIEDIDMRIYAGLDDKTLELLEKVEPESISEMNLEFQTINFVFLPTEVEKINQITEDIKASISGDAAWLLPYKEYDDFLDTMDIFSSSYDIKNQSVVLMIVLELAHRHLDELREGWLDKKEDTVIEQRKKWVHLSSIIGRDRVPPSSAMVIQKAVEKMKKKGDVGKDNLWQALEYLSADYLAGD